MDKFELGGLLAGIISIFFGIVVIVWPHILAYAIGIYLILYTLRHNRRRGCPAIGILAQTNTKPLVRTTGDDVASQAVLAQYLITNCELHIFPHNSHAPQRDSSAKFNKLVYEFFTK